MCIRDSHQSSSIIINHQRSSPIAIGKGSSWDFQVNQNRNLLTWYLTSLNGFAQSQNLTYFICLPQLMFWETDWCFVYMEVNFEKEKITFIKMFSIVSRLLCDPVARMEAIKGTLTRIQRLVMRIAKSASQSSTILTIAARSWSSSGSIWATFQFF